MRASAARSQTAQVDHGRCPGVESGSESGRGALYAVPLCAGRVVSGAEVAGVKFHRFIRQEQERLSTLRYNASMARIYKKPMLAAWLRFQCYMLRRWLDKHRHILEEEPGKPKIPDDY